MFFLTGDDFTFQKSPYSKEGTCAQRISFSFVKASIERINIRISSSNQWSSNLKAIFTYVVSSNNNKSFKQSNCCSFIGVSELITSKGICKIIIGVKKNNE